MVVDGVWSLYVRRRRAFTHLKIVDEGAAYVDADAESGLFVRRVRPPLRLLVYFLRTRLLPRSRNEAPAPTRVEGRERVTCSAQTRRAVGPRCSPAAPDERELPRRLSAGRRRRHRCGRSVLGVVPEATTQRSASVRTMVIINDGFITGARRASSHAEAGW